MKSSRNESHKYNVGLREETVKWAMLDHLRRPKSPFDDVIKAHFRMKKKEILAQLEEWRTEASEDAREVSFPELEAALKQV